MGLRMEPSSAAEKSILHHQGARLLLSSRHRKQHGYLTGQTASSINSDLAQVNLQPSKQRGEGAREASKLTAPQEPSAVAWRHVCNAATPPRTFAPPSRPLEHAPRPAHASINPHTNSALAACPVMSNRPRRRDEPGSTVEVRGIGAQSAPSS